MWCRGKGEIKRAGRKEGEIMEEVICLEGLSKKYGDLVAVDAVSFSVHEGEIFGYLGPNGAGKTSISAIFLRGLRSITPYSIILILSNKKKT